VAQIKDQKHFSGKAGGGAHMPPGSAIA